MDYAESCKLTGPTEICEETFEAVLRCGDKVTLGSAELDSC